MPTLVREASPLTALPPRVPRPAGAREGQWAAARLDEGEFGPSMLELVLWFPGTPSDDPTLAAALGPATAPATIRMNRLAVQALLPDRVAALPPIGDDVQLTGPGYSAAAFEGNGFFGARSVSLADGLLVAVRTGG